MSDTGTIRFEGLQTGSPTSETTSSPVAPALGHRNSGARLSSKERLALLEQFSVLLDSGIQIPAALQTMRAETTQPRPLRVLEHLENAVLAGRNLSEAMAELPAAFPAQVSQLVRAGERAGSMAEILQRTVEMLETDAEMRSKLRSAMMYPCVMLTLTIAVVIFLLTTIVPKFERMFSSKSATLPTPTRWLLATGDVLTTHWVWFLAGTVVLLVGAVAFFRTAQGVRFLDGLILRLPAAGDVYRSSILARCGRTLGLLVQAGVPAHVALEHARDVAGSPSYAELWRHAHQQVLNGGTLTDAVRDNPLLPPTFQQIVATGETTASLDRAMLRLADRYTRGMERRIADLATLIEPAMVVGMGAVVGFIALSIMLPIFQLSRT